MTRKENGLLARTIVNRLWLWHFGQAIAGNPNNFGSTGKKPTHPELLDWLAVWFRDDAKGSLKALHKLIVTSETYRQTSVPDDALMKRASGTDGSNTLLWRQNRRRLEAEAIRDSILIAAGKLDLTMHGPGVGAQFNDIGLMCDAAAQGLGIALVRLKLGQPWLDTGALVRLSPRNVPSPHAHYLCWRTGMMDRWECAAFAEWLKKSVL